MTFNSITVDDYRSVISGGIEHEFVNELFIFGHLESGAHFLFTNLKMSNE